MCMSLTQLNEQVHCLQYDYISGQMKPPNLRQLASIMKDLNILHAKNFPETLEKIIFGSVAIVRKLG